MKKFILILCTILLVVGITSGCATSDKPKNQLKNGSTLTDVTNAVVDKFGITLPIEVNEDVLKEIISFAYDGEDNKIKIDDINEFAGKISMANVSCDTVIALKTSSEKQPEAINILEKRKQNLMSQFENYLRDQYEKALAGQVFTVGNYTFLIIIGNPANGADTEFESAKQIVLDFFN